MRDPTYLFYSDEFVATGSLFWPDYWRPANTIFNINRDSMLWELTGVDYLDMLEQESGQVMVDKGRSGRQMEVVMFYAFHQPRLIETLNVAYGDKDLYRLAWIKTKTPFSMIRHPPGNTCYIY